MFIIIMTMMIVMIRIAMMVVITIRMLFVDDYDYCAMCHVHNVSGIGLCERLVFSANFTRHALSSALFRLLLHMSVGIFVHICLVRSVSLH